MIKSFRGKYAELILQGRQVPKGFPADVAKVARRKLVMLDGASVLEALRSPPANRLEALKGNLKGKHSSASTINGGLSFDGPRLAQKMSKSPIIIKDTLHG